MRVALQQGVTDEQWQHVGEWCEQVFPVEGVAHTWADTTWDILVFDGEGAEQPAAHLGFGKFVVETPSLGRVPVVGVGGVVVRPEYQGRRLPSLMFQHLHGCAEARRIAAVFALFCPHRLVRYYARFGYASHAAGYTFQQGAQTLSAPGMALMFRGLSPIDEPVTVPGEPW